MRTYLMHIHIHIFKYPNVVTKNNLRHLLIVKIGLSYQNEIFSFRLLIRIGY